MDLFSKFRLFRLRYWTSFLAIRIVNRRPLTHKGTSRNFQFFYKIETSMKRGILTTSRGLCATIVKQEQLTEYPTSPQILNLTSIYRQPLSATKDPQVHSQNTITVQPGGLTPHGPCYSPVAEVKHLAGRPQVFLQLFFLNLCMHIFFASARWAFTLIYNDYCRYINAYILQCIFCYG